MRAKNEARKARALNRLWTLVWRCLSPVLSPGGAVRGLRRARTISELTCEETGAPRGSRWGLVRVNWANNSATSARIQPKINIVPSASKSVVHTRKTRTCLVLPLSAPFSSAATPNGFHRFSNSFSLWRNSKEVAFLLKEMVKKRPFHLKKW